MGLLTKIFGNTDSGGEAAVERPEGPRGTEEPNADGGQRVQARDADPGSSGVRPAVEAPPATTEGGIRPAGASRRPEHPRMYLRPTPSRIDLSVPGSTRRPQIALRSTGKELGNSRGPRPQTASDSPRDPPSVSPRAPDAAPPAERSTRTPPTGTHPKPVMVVSPVSLTAEELQLPEGARPKMQTLMGLGMGIGVEVVMDSAPSRPSPELPAPASPELRVSAPPELRAEELPPMPIAATERERRIMRELLTALDGLLPAHRRRVEREMTLEQLARATPDVLSRELEAPIERARALSELVASYFRERQARAATDPLQTLSSALDELEESSRELDEHDEDQDAEQRLARGRRRAALTRVNLLLAERGELDLLDVLEPCATTERLSRLREWLSSDAARSSAARQS